MSNVSQQNSNFESWFQWRKENLRSLSKTLREGTTNNNKHNLQVQECNPGPGSRWCVPFLYMQLGKPLQHIQNILTVLTIRRSENIIDEYIYITSGIKCKITTETRKYVLNIRTLSSFQVQIVKYYITFTCTVVNSHMLAFTNSFRK